MVIRREAVLERELTYCARVARNYYYANDYDPSYLWHEKKDLQENLWQRKFEIFAGIHGFLYKFEHDIPS